MPNKPLDQAIDEAQTTAVEVVRQPSRSPIREGLEKARPSIEHALPTGFPGGVDRFTRIVLTAVRMVPDLERCTVPSVIGAAMQCAQLGLTPGVLGECWILPYYNSRTGQYEAQFQNGWRGLVALAKRAGYLVEAHAVHELDDFDYAYGDDPYIRHKPARGQRGQPIEWYAIIRDEATRRVVGSAVVDVHHVEKRRNAGKSASSPAWTKWYSEMALGKAVREALRTVAMTTELAAAVASEGMVRTEIDGQAEELAAAREPLDEGLDELEPADD